MADVTSPAELSPVPTVSLAHTRERLRDPGVTILDVLPRESYAAAHLPHAVNVPLAELARRAAQELPDRAREIITYCGGPT